MSGNVYTLTTQNVYKFREISPNVSNQQEMSLNIQILTNTVCAVALISRSAIAFVASKNIDAGRVFGTDSIAVFAFIDI